MTCAEVQQGGEWAAINGLVASPKLRDGRPAERARGLSIPFVGTPQLRPPPLLKSILVLGSTGSIGTQTLDLVRRPGSGVRVAGLAAATSWRALLEQAREFEAPLLALSDPAAAESARPLLPPGATLFAGPDALTDLVAAAEFETAVHGVVGGAGLRASVAVLERGKRLALANKESLVIAGELLMALAKEHGTEIIPVDSEHSAIHQCLRGERLGSVRRVHLTASGGPFRTRSAKDIASASPAEALRHPNWEMGPRISVGSATLMNKALEIIELHHLFGLERERIHVVVHPQSIVHSMVEFVDGSVIAQLGPPDMRGPIHYAIHHPDRVAAPLAGFDFASFANLTFEEPDLERFPALGLGYRCVEEGRDAGCVLNAADEVTVAAFLDGRIAFGEIARVNAHVLDRRPDRADSVEELLETDAHARRLAHDELGTTTAS
ncbi:MAG: 1-deoxy-D-xylulose-5-phosphate reductoisomerase [Planctomycetota bacterium]|nr:1-deoxy-D-xylulose-5-phosphate reductoisomerase [Planctomycetota bacterium]